mgnify:CR=1 FL=1
MIGAGRRDRKVTFYRSVTAENSYGEPVATGSPTALAQAFAMVAWGAGREIRQAAIEGNSQTATFIVLSTASLRGVTTKDYIEFEGANWDIAAIALRGRREIEFTATRRAA